MYLNFFLLIFIRIKPHALIVRSLLGSRAAHRPFYCYCASGAFSFFFLNPRLHSIGNDHYGDGILGNKIKESSGLFFRTRFNTDDVGFNLLHYLFETRA